MNEPQLDRLFADTPVLVAYLFGSHAASVKGLENDYAPHEGLFPSGHIPAQREAAKAKLAELLEHEAAQV